MEMKTLELNSKLTQRPIDSITRHQRSFGLASRFGIGGGGTLQYAQSMQARVCHNGLLDYLALCWSNHYSPVLRPDDFWFVILAELTTQIAKKPADYAGLFTTTPDKRQAIIVPTDDVTTIDPLLVLERLGDCVPTDIENFMPTFGTSTPASRLAMAVSFCDLVSPYYSYGTKLCGFPAIRFRGCLEDWDHLVFRLAKLRDVFKGALHDYLERCGAVVEELVGALRHDDDQKFIGRMVALRECGSGSQQEMDGWIMHLLFKEKQWAQLEGLPPHIACMKYTNLDTGRKFKLFTGLTESHVLDGGFLQPEYGRYSVEDLPPKPESDSRSHKFEVISAPVQPGARKLRGEWRIE